MSVKTRRIIYVIIAAAVVIAGVLIMLMSRSGSADVSAQEKIDLGNIYLTELSYDKAVIQFTEAIEIDPANAEAYIGLAKAYDGLGDTDKALEALQKGYDLTGDERVLELIQQFKPAEETTVTEVTEVTETTTVTTVETITVPDLSGLSESEAIDACEKAGIGYNITKTENETVEKGYVISQSTAAGEEVPLSAVLSFSVSEGKTVVTASETAAASVTAAETAASQSLSKTVNYAEDLLGMKVSDVFDIYGNGDVEWYAGGYGYVLPSGIYVMVYNEYVQYDAEHTVSSAHIDPDEAEICRVVINRNTSPALPINSDINIGMTMGEIIDAADCGLTKEDIYSNDMYDDYGLDIKKYPYDISVVSESNELDDPVYSIMLQASDIAERDSKFYGN